MTLSVSHIINQFSSLSSATYVFDFPIKAATDLEVEFYDGNAGTWRVLILDVDYNVAESLDQITLLDPSRFYSSVNRLAVKRQRPYLQNTTYVLGDKFPAKVTEGAFDDLGMQIQQIAHTSDRALRVADYESGIGPLPGVVDRAEKYLFFDSAGNILLTDGDASAPDAPRTVLRQDSVAVYGQTVFTTLHPYTPGSSNLLVFVNGLAQVPGVDYLETNENTVTFISPLGEGFKVLFLFGLILDAQTTIYYIRATAGTAIKNGIGELTLEARRIRDGVDTLITDGSIQLYVGTTVVSAVNGFVAGSNGYTGIFNSADIGGSLTVVLKDGPYGTALYSVTLIDVFDGQDTFLYYIKPLSGTAIKNSLGTLTIEAHRLANGVDEKITSGTIQLYVGTTLVSATNGYATGSNGYTGVFDDTDINNSVVVSLKDGPNGVVRDTITLVDIADGSSGGPGIAGVYGYIEVNGSLGHTRANDQVTWAPVSATTQLDCTFVQAGAAVARVAWLITRASDGTFTGAPVTHKDGDLNSSRVTVIERQEGTAAFTIEFDYSYLGDETAVAETVISSLAGSEGDPGTPASLYYIKALTGTAIKNGTGTLTVEAHRLDGGIDVFLQAGTIKLYVGETLVTEANGFAAGSDGYTGVFDSGDISGATIVTIKDGPTGETLDTITLVDIDDGANGLNGVFGYVEPDGPLAWTRAPDGVTWTPTATSRKFNCTFVQGGVAVARKAITVTRDANGLLTGAFAATHKDGDLNTSRVTVAQTGSGSQVISVSFTYSYGGFTSYVSETLLTSLSGTQGLPGSGTPGTPALSVYCTADALQIMTYQNGGSAQASLDLAFGYMTVYSGSTDVTATAVINAAVVAGCTGTINTSTNSPVNGKAKGYYKINSLSADNATFSVQITYGGVTITKVITVVRSYVGYEIVAALPSTNLFNGRMVFLTGDGKLYRYNNGWTRQVDGLDIIDGTVYANSIATGQITAAKCNITQLSSLSADLGSITAGIIALATSGYIRSGQTNYDTGIGFFLGFHSGVPKFSIGNPAGNFLRWNGSTLEINAIDSSVKAVITALTAQASGFAASGPVQTLPISVAVTGGKAPYTYLWSLLSEVRGASQNIAGSTTVNPIFGAPSVEDADPSVSIWNLKVTDATGVSINSTGYVRLRWVDIR